MNNPDHISESLETIFWVKILKFFDADLGWKKFGSEIRMKHPGSATLEFNVVFVVLCSWWRLVECAAGGTGSPRAHSSGSRFLFVSGNRGTGPSGWKHILRSSVADPDPKVLGPPGYASGSVSHKYGSGSFLLQSKTSKKNLEFYCFLTSLWLFISEVLLGGRGLLALISLTTVLDLHFHTQNFRL